MKFKIG